VKAHIKRGDIHMLKEMWQEAIGDYERAHNVDHARQFDTRAKYQKAKLELKKSKRKDYYKVLDVSKTGDEQAIKKAYKKMALKWHPDRHNTNEEMREKAESMFKDIGEAFSVLNDPQKKHRYDNGEDLEEIESGGGHHHHGDAQDIFQMFFSQGGGRAHSGFHSHF